MNIQQTILKGIQEQLFYNDYLVLPTFGGFVLKSSPAHFSGSSGSLMPPSKTVVFNAQLKQNDGILVSWLQEKLKCSPVEALQHLTEFSEFCSSLLKTKRRFSFDGIGFFYLDFEDNLCFEARQDLNFLSSSFGLTALSVQTIEREIKEPEKQSTVFVDRTISEHSTAAAIPKTKRSRKLLIPALLSILFLSTLGLVLSNVKLNGVFRSALLTTNETPQYSFINYPAINLENQCDNEPAYVADANGIAMLELDEHKILAVKAIETSNTTPTESNVKSSTFNSAFEIVFGCFSQKENAEKMIKKLQNKQLSASVSTKNQKGLYVVSLSAFTSHELAVSKLAELKGTYPTAWIRCPGK